MQRRRAGFGCTRPHDIALLNVPTAEHPREVELLSPLMRWHSLPHGAPIPPGGPPHLANGC